MYEIVGEIDGEIDLALGQALRWVSGTQSYPLWVGPRGSGRSGGASRKFRAFLPAGPLGLRARLVVPAEETFAKDVVLHRVRKANGLLRWYRGRLHWPRKTRTAGGLSLATTRACWEIPEPEWWSRVNQEIVLRGWLVSERGEAPLRYRVRLGEREIVHRDRESRGDVVAYFREKEGREVPLDCGFEIRFRTGGGWKAVRLEAELRGGGWVPLGRRLFWVGGNRRRGASQRWWKGLREYSRERRLRKEYREGLPAPAPAGDPDGCTLQVILPVFNGSKAVERCLQTVESSRASNDRKFEVIVVDDASTDRDLCRFLDREFAAGRVRLVRHSENRGFVRSVQTGLRQHRQCDVVLLNSDTQVFGNWLDRLAACADADPSIASVTPFSNNATLCSYPVIDRANSMEPETARELDAQCAALNAGQCYDIPTGVGCCLYLRRRAIEKVGGPDARHFGSGYGEENDWCRRFARAGWRNVHCTDTFVYHEGFGSFGDSGRSRRLAAVKEVNRLHPGYGALVREHFERDPGAPFRARIDAARIETLPKPRILFVSHGRGGGTEVHMRGLAQFYAGEAAFFLLTVDPDRTGGLRFVRLTSGEPVAIGSGQPGWPEILAFCRRARIARVHYHHLVDLDPRARHLADELELPYDVTLHDFYSFCPQITLTQGGDQYCGLPPVTTCEICVRQRPPAGWHGTVAKFRDGQRLFLSKADRVIVPSRAARKILARYFPEINLRVAYHPERHEDAGEATQMRGERRSDDLQAAPPVGKGGKNERPKAEKAGRWKFGGTEREQVRVVAVLGAISPEKGADRLEAVARRAAAEERALRFLLVGKAYRTLRVQPPAYLDTTGPYEREELGVLLQSQGVDVIWFPVQWPETYSYTLSEALRLGYPLLLPDLGAFPERAMGLPGVELLPWDASVVRTLDALERLPAGPFPDRPLHPDDSARFYDREYLQAVTEGSLS